eukprot:g4273.t1
MARNSSRKRKSHESEGRSSSSSSKAAASQVAAVPKRKKLGPHHHVFVQQLMAKKVFTEAEAIEVSYFSLPYFCNDEELKEKYNDPNDLIAGKGLLKRIIEELNVDLGELGFAIARHKFEIDFKSYYCFVNKYTPNPETASAEEMFKKCDIGILKHVSESERYLFQEIMRECITSPTGYMKQSAIEALRFRKSTTTKQTNNTTTTNTTNESEEEEGTQQESQTQTQVEQDTDENNQNTTNNSLLQLGAQTKTTVTQTKTTRLSLKEVTSFLCRMEKSGWLKKLSKTENKVTYCLGVRSFCALQPVLYELGAEKCKLCRLPVVCPRSTNVPNFPVGYKGHHGRCFNTLSKEDQQTIVRNFKRQ